MENQLTMEQPLNGLDKENIREFFIKQMDSHDPRMEYRIL
jgi:hypothetical protein